MYGIVLLAAIILAIYLFKTRNTRPWMIGGRRRSSAKAGRRLSGRRGHARITSKKDD